MTRSVVICEKPSQAANIRAAVGSRFGQVMPARGHLLKLAEPQDVRPEWRSWSAELLHPGKPYPTKPAKGKEGILDGIRRALKQADSAIVATDLGREGHLIAMEIIEHAGFRGPVRRACFNAEDPETLRAAFNDLRPITEFAGLLGAGKARQQSDQICNLTLTRAATVHLTRKGSGALGIGRVRTPTLAITCRREQEITGFTPETSWVVEATAETAAGTFTAICRRAPGTEGPITERSRAEEIAEAARDRTVTISGQQAGKAGRRRRRRTTSQPSRPTRRAGSNGRRSMPSRWAQQLYSDLKIITYPRVDARVLPEAMTADAPALRDAIRQTIGGEEREPVLRIGGTRRHHFSDKRMQVHEHHAIIPNIRTAAELPALWQQANGDQRQLAAMILRRYAAMTDADLQFTELTLSFHVDAPGGRAEFAARGRTTTDPGWTRWERPAPKEQGEGKDEGAPGPLPKVADGTGGRCTGAQAGRAENQTAGAPLRRNPDHRHEGGVEVPAGGRTPQPAEGGRRHRQAGNPGPGGRNPGAAGPARKGEGQAEADRDRNGALEAAREPGAGIGRSRHDRRMGGRVRPAGGRRRKWLDGTGRQAGGGGGIGGGRHPRRGRKRSRGPRTRTAQTEGTRRVPAAAAGRHPKGRSPSCGNSRPSAARRSTTQEPHR